MKEISKVELLICRLWSVIMAANES